MLDRKLTYMIVICIISASFILNSKNFLSSFQDDENIDKSFNANREQIDSTVSSTSELEVPTLNDKGTEELQIVNCGSNFVQEDPSYYQIQQRYFSSLKDSVTESEQLNYALFSHLPEDNKRLNLLFGFNREYSDNQVVLAEILNLCAKSENPKCTTEFVEQAIATDYQNGAMWVNAIGFYLTKENDEKVLEAIAGMNKAPIFNGRFGEKVLIYATALDSSPANDFISNVISGIGIEAAKTINFLGITSWCKEGINDARKSSACLTLGRNLEQRSKTLLLNQLGIALQKLVYSAEGNDKAVATLEKKLDDFKNDAFLKHHHEASSLLFRKQPYLRQYLSNFDAIGEAEAAKELVIDAAKLSKVFGHDLCQPNAE